MATASLRSASPSSKLSGRHEHVLPGGGELGLQILDLVDETLSRARIRFWFQTSVALSLWIVRYRITDSALSALVYFVTAVVVTPCPPPPRTYCAVKWPYI